MVGAISSTTTTTVSLSSSSSGTKSAAALEAQLSAKKDELADAQTSEKKAEIQKAIAALKAEIAALKAAKQDDAAKPGTQAGEGTKSSLLGTRNFEEGDPFGKRELYV